MSQSSGSNPWDFLNAPPPAPAIDPALAAILTPEPAPPPLPKPAPPPPPKTNAPAKPGARFRVKLEPETEVPEELVTPEKVKSWSASLIFHTVLLLILAFTILSQPARDQRVIDTRLPAGDPHGSDLGQQFTGGLGMDDPLDMPYAPVDTSTEPQPTLTIPDTASLLPDLKSPLRPPSADPTASARGGGVTLEGTGQAGSGDGFGVAKFGLGGKETVNDIEIKVGNPQFTLIWNTTADMDLHVLEPGGSHIYWERRRGNAGGELDVDDVDGLGPENIYWGGGLNKGNGPPGEYKWYVHYYGGREGNVPTRWKVRLKHNNDYKVFEGRLNSIGQRSKIYTFKIDDADPEANQPKDAPERKADPGDMNDFDRPPGTFDNPSSASSRGMREFGREVTQELEDSSPQPMRPDRPAAGPERPAQPATPAAPPRPAGPPRDASGWVVVEPDDIKFRALFPAEPFEEVRALENLPGQPELRSWKLDRGEGGLSVSVLALPEARRQRNIETLLQDEAHAVAAELGATQSDIKPTEISGHPARELRCSVADRVVAGGGRARALLVVRDGRLYRVDAIGTPAFLALPEVDRFLRAFALKD